LKPVLPAVLSLHCFFGNVITRPSIINEKLLYTYSILSAAVELWVQPRNLVNVSSSPLKAALTAPAMVIPTDVTILV